MKKYDKYKDSGIEWIGQMPEHWDVVKMKYVLSGIQDGTHGTYNRVTTGEYLLSAKNVFEDGLRLTDNESMVSLEDYKSIISNGFPKNGDILICCVGTIGRCCIYNLDKAIAFQRSVTFLRVNERYLNRFLLYNLRSTFAADQIGQYAKTSAQSGVYMGDLKQIVVSLPPLSEQEAIAAYLDEKTGQIDALMAEKSEQLKDLQTLRTSIITEAVTKGLNPKAPMKDSGIEWIGEIPEGWETRKIKSVSKVNGRIGYRGYTTDDLVSQGEGAFAIGGKHISNCVLDLSNPDFISWEKYYESPEIMVKKGDIVMAQRGSLGKAAIIEAEIGPATINPSLVLLNNITCDNKYLYFYLVSSSTLSLIGLLNTATAVPMISQNQIENMRIPLPPLSEQRAIAAYLDEKTSEIDAMKAELTAQIEDLKTLRTSLITEAVTGQVDVRDWKTKH